LPHTNGFDLTRLLLSYKVQAITLILIWIVAMLFSAEFILTLVMMLLLAMALFELKIEGQRVQFGFRGQLKTNFQEFLSNKAYLVAMVPFFIVFVTAFWSGDLHYTVERLRIKLPFLVLPFAFASIPHFKRREVLLIFYFLVATMTVACLYVGITYLANFEEINELIGKGQPMPTPSNHIRFSLVLGFSVIAGAILFSRRFVLRYPRERWLIGGMTVFLFLFIHVLSVRSGILVLYLAVLLLSIRYVYLTKRYVMGAAALMALFLVPVAAYFLVPSFQTKIHYARWDLMQYWQGRGSDYSDSERLTSLEVGLKIGNEHPLLGVGAGDLKKEVKKRYEAEYTDASKPKMPHNQFVTLYAGSGMIGLLVFLWSFFFPLFYRRQYRATFLLALHIIIFFSFMMENTIENNFGISFYLLFLLIGINFLSRTEGPDLHSNTE
jgi:O-antigen ligase